MGIINWNYVAFLLGWASTKLDLARRCTKVWCDSGYTWGPEARKAMRRERREHAGGAWWCLLRASFYVRAGAGRAAS